jgi:hypothetical protein
LICLFYRRVIREIVACIEQNDVYNPIRLFIKESSKSIRRRIRRRSMYREILFLAIVALGREKLSYGTYTDLFLIIGNLFFFLN